MKDLREEFVRLDDDMKEYCLEECRHLAEGMTKFSVVCIDAGYKPRDWNGAGELATTIFEKHKIPKRPLSKWEIAAGRGDKDKSIRRPERPEEFEIAASAAYFGGRAEVSRIGYVPGPIYQYDINSAYPAAILDLPCPMHTSWEHKPRAKQLPPRGTLYLAKVQFVHSLGNQYGFDRVERQR